MTLTAAELTAKSAGSVYLAPDGTAVPTDLAALAAAYTDNHVGWISQPGPEFQGFEGEITRIRGWNAQGAIRTTRRLGEPAVALTLLQWNSTTLGYYFPGSTYDAPTSTLSIPSSPGAPTQYTALVVVEDGADKLGLWVARVEAAAAGSFTFPEGEAAEIPLTLTVLEPDSGELAAVVGLPVAA